MTPKQKFGDFTIIMPEGCEFIAQNLVNIYTRQIGLLLQRQLAEAALNASEAKYRVLFETLPTGVTMADETGQILESNRVAERILGLTPTEQAQRKIDGSEWSIIRPDGSPMPADEYASVRAMKEQRLINQVEMGVAQSSGEIAWISVNAAPLPNIGVVITYEDITDRKLIEAVEHAQRLLLVSEINERKKAEEKLDKQNQVLKGLYENMLDVLQFQNLDDLLRLIVVRAAELLEAPYSEIMLLDQGQLIIRATTPNQSFLIGDRAGPEEARFSWQAVNTGQVTVIDDYVTWPHRRAIYDSTPTHAIVSFPILSGDQCIGVFDLSRDQVNYPFTSEQIQVGNLFVRLATLAIENSRLYEEGA